MRRAVSWVWIALTVGCGSADYAELDAFEERAEVESASAPEEIPAIFRDDPTAKPWGHPYPVDEVQVDEAEKTSVIMLHGWSVQSEIRMRGGHNGYEPIDTNYSSLADAAAGLRGRCGRLDGFVDNTWQACLLPYSANTVANQGTGKTWSWAIDWPSCNGSTSIPFEDGAERAFAAATYQTGWNFPKVSMSNNPDIVIKCASASEKQLLNSGGAIAGGVPYGALTFGHGATISHRDVCEGPNSTGASFYHFSDRVWSYTKGRIYINWNLFWTEVMGCPQWSTSAEEIARRAAHYIILHELGHVLGFTHQSDTSNSENVMYKLRGCNAYWAAPPRYRPLMREALAFASFPSDGATSLQLHDTDLSCYSPL